MAESYGRTMHLLSEAGSGGIYIADDVIAHIAGLAAKEIEGVDDIAGGLARRGIRVTTTEGIVVVDIAITIKYNYSIPEVCAAVQDRVKTSVEEMTSLTVETVNVKVTGVEAN